MDERWLHEPAGLPVPVAEDGALVEDPALDEKGYRIVRTEQAVFAAHPNAAHFRYPYLYGPYQPAPREWTIVRRILDGRQRIVVADDGLTLHHHGYTENCAAAVVPRSNIPSAARGTIFNIGDEEVLTVRQVVELCARELGAEIEIVSMPYELAVPAWPLLAQPSATHRVLDLTRVHHQLGHRDVVPAREAVAHTARWLAEHPPARGGLEEMVLTDPFDYAAEDALMDAWIAARASVASRVREPARLRPRVQRTRRAAAHCTRSSSSERAARRRARPRPVDRARPGRTRRRCSPTRAPTVIKVERPGIGDIAPLGRRPRQRDERAVPRVQPREALDRGRPADAGRRSTSCAGSRPTPTCSSRTSGPA